MEISLELIARHGHFPNAKPQGNKAAYLKPEPATIKGLLRLVFAGMDLHDASGRPFSVLERLTGVADVPEDFAERYAAQADWDPRREGTAYVYMVI